MGVFVENECQYRRISEQNFSRIVEEGGSSRCLYLQPGLKFRLTELSTPCDISVDFKRDQPFLEFGCLLSGKISGTFSINGGREQSFGSASEQTWCSFCSQAQGTIEYKAGQTVCSVLFYIHGPLLQSLLAFKKTHLTGLPRKKDCKSFNGLDELTPAVRQVVSQIMKVEEWSDLSNRLFLTSKAYELLSLLSVDEGNAEAVSYNETCLPGVDRAREILDQNLAATHTLDDIARQSGLCVTRLTEEFRRQYGTTVFGYLRQQRLAWARELITLHNMSASEAAWEVGYSSLSSFHRAFCARYGATPGSINRKV